METNTIVPVSAMTDSIDQLRERLEKENNPEMLPIKTLKFRIAHESKTGSVISLRASTISLVALLNVADLGLQVESLHCFRSGADSVAVVLVRPVIIN